MSIDCIVDEEVNAQKWGEVHRICLACWGPYVRFEFSTTPSFTGIHSTILKGGERHRRLEKCIEILNCLPRRGHQRPLLASLGPPSETRPWSKRFLMSPSALAPLKRLPHVL